MEISEGLEKYGLNHREALVYQELLKMGSATASEIAKNTKILRQTIYEILDDLLDKGLISFVIKNNVKHFEATNPQRFKEILNEKKEAIDNIFDQMKSLQSSQTKKPLVGIYEGVEGLKTIYSKIIRDKPKELFEIGDNESFSEIMKLYFVENYMIKRVENKTNFKLIADESARELFSTNKKQFRETRFNEKLKNSKTATFIYDDIVIMITFEKQPIGILIKNKLIAEMQKIQFDSLWEESKN